MLQTKNIFENNTALGLLFDVLGCPVKKVHVRTAVVQSTIDKTYLNYHIILRLVQKCPVSDVVIDRERNFYLFSKTQLLTFCLHKIDGSFCKTSRGGYS